MQDFLKKRDEIHEKYTNEFDWWETEQNFEKDIKSLMPEVKDLEWLCPMQADIMLIAKTDIVIYALTCDGIVKYQTLLNKGDIGDFGLQDYEDIESLNKMKKCANEHHANIVLELLK